MRLLVLLVHERSLTQGDWSPHEGGTLLKKFRRGSFENTFNNGRLRLSHTSLPFFLHTEPNLFALIFPSRVTARQCDGLALFSKLLYLLGVLNNSGVRVQHGGTMLCPTG